jgi:nuclear migration protein JNM1
MYAYPSSPTEDGPSRQPAPAYRLKQLQAELAALEIEIVEGRTGDADAEDDHDRGELLSGIVGVREKLEQISKLKTGRAKLVSSVIQDTVPTAEGEEEPTSSTSPEMKASGTHDAEKPPSKIANMAEMDRRVGQLEELVGSSSAALDEVCTYILSVGQAG